MSNAYCLSSLMLYFQGSALLWEGSWLLLFCTEGRNVIRNSVSKRMSCNVDPFQRPALTKPMAGKGAVSLLLARWAVANFLKDSPVSWQSVSWSLSGKWRLEAPYLQLEIYYSTRQLLKEIYLLNFLPLLSRFPEDRQNVQKSFVFFIKPRSTNLESKQKTGNKQHEVFPNKEREQSSANKLNVKL